MNLQERTTDTIRSNSTTRGSHGFTFPHRIGRRTIGNQQQIKSTESPLDQLDPPSACTQLPRVYIQSRCQHTDGWTPPSQRARSTTCSSSNSKQGAETTDTQGRRTSSREQTQQANKQRLDQVWLERFEVVDRLEKLCRDSLGGIVRAATGDVCEVAGNQIE